MAGELLAMTTLADRETAERLAAGLVEARLAACVSIVPGLTSVYRWQGQVETETECLLLVKTNGDVWDRLEAFVAAEHPYELPELVAVPVQAGSKAYLEWLAGELTR